VNGAEPQTEEISHKDAGSLHDWGERPKDKLLHYNEKVFWEPKSDSKDGDVRALSSTAVKIVEDTFSCSFKPEKHKNIKRKQPIPDTPFTKVNPTIQSK